MIKVVMVILTVERVKKKWKEWIG